MTGKNTNRHNHLDNIQESFTHNARNQLISYTREDNGVPVTSAGYAYDALGRRTQKTVNGTDTNYLYDQEDILLEQDTNGTTLTQYLHGPGIDNPISLTRGGQTYYYHADAQGSIIAITDATGAVVQSYDYDAFGNITNEQDPTFENPYTYTSRERDEESGLYFYRARYYDPTIGRFMEEDPIGFAGGDVNLYGYVGNDAVNWVDPLGLEILICNRKVDGPPFIGNHAYPFDTTTNTSEGMRGSSGSGADATNEKGPSADSCNVVEGSKGKEKEIMDFMRDNQNNGIWFPGINDCHNAAQDAVENVGLNFPGAPGGRFGPPVNSPPPTSGGSNRLNFSANSFNAL